MSDDYGITSAQYHAGISKLWEVLGIIEAQDEDVFSLAAKKIVILQSRNDKLIAHLQNIYDGDGNIDFDDLYDILKEQGRDPNE